MIIDYPVIIASFMISFLLVLIAMPLWIKRAHRAGLTGKDTHKSDGRQVANLGGLVVIFAFLFGTLGYIAVDTFIICVRQFRCAVFQGFADNGCSCHSAYTYNIGIGR